MILSLATSVMTITAMWLVSKKRAAGWAVGLANQGLWLALIISTRAWGLLLLSVVLVWIYSRALWAWTRPAVKEVRLAPGSGTEPNCYAGRPCGHPGDPHALTCPGHPSHPDYR